MSIQVVETTDVSTKEQLSVIICLDKGGEIVERFLKLFYVSSDRSAVAISDVVRSILSRYGESLKKKLIMQTYDGASVMSGQIGGLQTLIRQEYQFAFFFHCAAHRLNFIDAKSASTLPPVKVFFANISAFSTFTSFSARRTDLFRSQGIEVPHPGIPGGANFQEPPVLSLINTMLCSLFWRALLITHKAGMMGL